MITMMIITMTMIIVITMIAMIAMMMMVLLQVEVAVGKEAEEELVAFHPNHSAFDNLQMCKCANMHKCKCC